jgi:HPt (histidine-containing phosphotransfer) domain-containing protein
MDDYISKPFNEEHLYKLIIKYGSLSKRFNDESVIDLTYLQSLSKGDKVFEEAMLKSFVDQVPGELEALNSSIEKEDFHSIRTIAHTMKSTVSYLGMMPLLTRLEEIVDLASQGKDLYRIRKEYEEVKIVSLAGLAEVRKRLQN